MNEETLTRRFAEAREALAVLAGELLVHGKNYDSRSIGHMWDDVRKMEREIRAAAKAEDEL